MILYIFRFIYCFSDPPHLIKTVRNCWASKKRSLWVSASFDVSHQFLIWQHLIDLYTKDNGKGSGLSMVPKLKFEHLHLTSFSKMRVDLAAQVCGVHVFYFNQSIVTAGTERDSE